MEDLDAQGKPIDPEPVPETDRLPVELIVRSSDDDEARAHLLDLLETAHELELAGPEAVGLTPVKR